MASIASTLAKGRLRGHNAPPTPADSRADVPAPVKPEKDKDMSLDVKMQELLREDRELRRFNTVFREQTLINSAEECSVIWAQVKGFPWWPAQLMEHVEAKKRFQDYSEKRMQSHCPVMFFGTLEVAWMMSKQVKSWATGIEACLHMKASKNKQLRAALNQVDAFLGTKGKRRAPDKWFCKPPAMPSTRPGASRRATLNSNPQDEVAGTPTDDKSNDPALAQALEGAGDGKSTTQSKVVDSPSSRAARDPPHDKDGKLRVRAARGASPPARPTASREPASSDTDLDRMAHALNGGSPRDERLRKSADGRCNSAADPQGSSRSSRGRDELARGQKRDTRTDASNGSRPAGLSKEMKALELSSGARRPEPSSRGKGTERERSVGGGSRCDDDSTSAIDEAMIPKRMTRSQGHAELGASDLENLEPRKTQKRMSNGSLAPGAPVDGVVTDSVIKAEEEARVEEPETSTQGPSSRLPADSDRAAGSVFVSGSVNGEEKPDGDDSALHKAAASLLADAAELAEQGAASAQPEAQAAAAELAEPDAPAPMLLEAAPAPPVDDVVPMDVDQTSSVQPAAAHAVQPVAQHVEMPVRLADEVCTSPLQVEAAVQQPPPPPQEPQAVDEAVDVGAETACAEDDGAAMECQPSSEAGAVKSEGGTRSEASERVTSEDSPEGMKEREEDGQDADGSDEQDGLGEDSVRRSKRENPNRKSAMELMRGAASAGGRSERTKAPRSTGPMVSKRGRKIYNRDYLSFDGPDDLYKRARHDSDPPYDGPERSETSHLLSGNSLDILAEVAASRSTTDHFAPAPKPPPPVAAPGTLALAPAEVRQAVLQHRQQCAVIYQQLCEKQQVQPLEPAEVAAMNNAWQGLHAAPDITSHKPAAREHTSLAWRGPNGTRSSGSQGGGTLPGLAPEAPLPALPRQNKSPSGTLPALATATSGGTLPDLPPAGPPSSTLPGLWPNEQAAGPSQPRDKYAIAQCPLPKWREPRLPRHATEFVIPPEYLLMRTQKHKMVEVNKYPPELKPKKLPARDIQICACRRDKESEGTDHYCCNEGCLNRQARILCDARSCPCRGDCRNKQFNLRLQPKMAVQLTENRGFGLFAQEPISRRAFVIEYAGEIITEEQRLTRLVQARATGTIHFYIMELQKGLYIDAGERGSNARFINSSCDPNCETQKWKDAATGETRVGIFALRDIARGEELTYDYHFQHSGPQALAQGFRCMCGAANCRGTMDTNPERARDLWRKIRVKWDDDDTYYEGYIVKYNPNNGKHTVLYLGEPGQAGTTETLNLATAEFEWVDEPEPVPPLAPALEDRPQRLPSNAAPVANPRRLPPREQPAIAPPPLPREPAAPPTGHQPQRADPPRGTLPPAAPAQARVPLPDPLPVPGWALCDPEPDSGAANGRDPCGLDLLSSVVAALPDRPRTPLLFHPDSGRDGPAPEAQPPTKIPFFSILTRLQPTTDLPPDIEVVDKPFGVLHNQNKPPFSQKTVRVHRSAPSPLQPSQFARGTAANASGPPQLSAQPNPNPLSAGAAQRGFKRPHTARSSPPSSTHPLHMAAMSWMQGASDASREPQSHARHEPHHDLSLPSTPKMDAQSQQILRTLLTASQPQQHQPSSMGMPNGAPHEQPALLVGMPGGGSSVSARLMQLQQPNSNLQVVVGSNQMRIAMAQMQHRLQRFQESQGGSLAGVLDGTGGVLDLHAALQQRRFDAASAMTHPARGHGGSAGTNYLPSADGPSLAARSAPTNRAGPDASRSRDAGLEGSQQMHFPGDAPFARSPHEQHAMPGLGAAASSAMHHGLSHGGGALFGVGPSGASAPSAFTPNPSANGGPGGAGMRSAPRTSAQGFMAAAPGPSGSRNPTDARSPTHEFASSGVFGAFDVFNASQAPRSLGGQHATLPQRYERPRSAAQSPSPGVSSHDAASRRPFSSPGAVQPPSRSSAEQGAHKPSTPGTSSARGLEANGPSAPAPPSKAPALAENPNNAVPLVCQAEMTPPMFQAWVQRAEEMGIPAENAWDPAHQHLLSEFVSSRARTPPPPPPTAPAPLDEFTAPPLAKRAKPSPPPPAPTIHDALARRAAMNNPAAGPAAAQQPAAPRDPSLARSEPSPPTAPHEPPPKPPSPRQVNSSLATSTGVAAGAAAPTDAAAAATTPVANHAAVPHDGGISQEPEQQQPAFAVGNPVPAAPAVDRPSPATVTNTVADHARLMSPEPLQLSLSPPPDNHPPNLRAHEANVPAKGPPGGPIHSSSTPGQAPASAEPAHSKKLPNGFPCNHATMPNPEALAWAPPTQLPLNAVSSSKAS